MHELKFGLPIGTSQPVFHRHLEPKGLFIDARSLGNKVAGLINRSNAGPEQAITEPSDGSIL